MRWTSAEVEAVRQHYATMVRQELQALLPNRTWTAIQNQGNGMGIRRAAERTYWTPDDIEVLKVEYANGARVDELAKRLKHSPSAIKTIASRLHASRNHRQAPKARPGERARDEPLLEHLTDVERGYIAGLFDGEGCIGFYRIGLRVSIANTDPRVITWLKDKIPSSLVYHYQRQPPKRDAWIWMLPPIAGVRFCQEIHNLLLIKREEAELVAEALKAGIAPLSKEQRQHLQDTLHTLKTKGARHIV